MAPPAVSELVHRHRLRLGMSQRELAERSGVSERAIRNIERGTRIPRRETLRLVASALQLEDGDMVALLAAARPGAAPGLDLPTVVTALNIPSVHGELIGRTGQLRVLVDVVTGGRRRLVTITGPTGVGKSRLAAEVATLLHGRTDLLVRWLDLSAVDDPGLVDEWIAVALGCGPSRLPAVERVTAHIAEQPVVLFIDRFEHVVSAAGVVIDMVRRCPNLQVVVTSQCRLRLRDEWLLRVPPLPADAAATLFRVRAGEADAALSSDEGIEAAIATVCRKVGYLPLAIELAAARMRYMQPMELADRLGQPMRVLVGGSRDTPQRHWSVRAAIEASLDVVSPRARTSFAWLGAFVGGVRLEDLEACVAAVGANPADVVTDLSELVDMNLVWANTEAQASRYVLPELVAEFAAEALIHTEGHALIRRCVAAHFLTRVRRAHSGSGPQVTPRDAANIRTALTWVLAHDLSMVDDAAIVALGHFFEVTGLLAAGQQNLTRLGEAGLPLAWTRASHLALLRGDASIAAELVERTLAAPGGAARATALNLLGIIAVEQDDLSLARHQFRSALQHARREGDLALQGKIMSNLSAVSMELGLLRSARRQSTAALSVKRQTGAGPLELGRTLFNLAELTAEMNLLDDAIQHAGDAIPLLVSAGHQRLAAAAEAKTALILLLKPDARSALSAVDRAYALLAGHGHDDRRMEAIVRMRTSVVHQAVGNSQAAYDDLRLAMEYASTRLARDRDELTRTLDLHAGYLTQRNPAAAAALSDKAKHLRDGTTGAEGQTFLNLLASPAPAAGRQNTRTAAGTNGPKNPPR